MLNHVEASYWLAFRVPPQKECAAERIARQRGFYAVVPMEVRTRGRQVRKSKKKIEYPMINGYVFMRFDGQCDWYGLSQISLVRSVVGFNDTPARISQESMNVLLKRSGQQLPHLHSENMRRSFTPGETVEVANGPLRNSLVKVEKIFGEKARIVFKMLGVEREIEVPINSLSAA